MIRISCAEGLKRYVCYLCNSTVSRGCGPAFNESQAARVWCEPGQVCIKTTTHVVNGPKTFSPSSFVLQHES